MIQNFWDGVRFYCMHGHEIPVKMKTVDGPTSLFYACPKYYPQNRAPDERACSNRLSLDDADKIVTHFMDKITESEAKGIQMFFPKGYRWEYKSIEVTVLEHTMEKLRIGILNRRALK